MRTVAPAVDPKLLTSKLTRTVKLIAEPELREITSALVALASVKLANDIALPEFVEDVCQSLQSGKSQQSDPGRLKNRLSAILRATPLILAAKASSLQREHTNILMNTRVISDIRPVFLDEPNTAEGAMIVHLLKLSYFHDNEPREFFVAMDGDDLSALERTVARAEAKTKALKGIIAKTGLADLEEK